MKRFLGFVLFMSFLMTIFGMEYIVKWERHCEWHPFLKILIGSLGVYYLLFVFFAGICLLIEGKPKFVRKNEIKS